MCHVRTVKWWGLTMNIDGQWSWHLVKSIENVDVKGWLDTLYVLCINTRWEERKRKFDCVMIFCTNSWPTDKMMFYTINAPPPRTNLDWITCRATNNFRHCHKYRQQGPANYILTDQLLPTWSIWTFKFFLMSLKTDESSTELLTFLHCHFFIRYRWSKCRACQQTQLPAVWSYLHGISFI